MHRRANITLPEETLRLIDRLVEKGERSRFIDEAVRHYVRTVGGANLRKRLREGARRQAESDLRLAEEWFALDDAWHNDRKGRLAVGDRTATTGVVATGEH